MVSEGDVLVEVTAQDEGDRQYNWSCRLQLSKPALRLRRLWAENHGVPESAVAFEDPSVARSGVDSSAWQEEDLVDLSRTPAELGWGERPKVLLVAVPVDEAWMEGAECASVPTKKARVEKEGSKVAEARVAARVAEARVAEARVAEARVPEARVPAARVPEARVPEAVSRGSAPGRGRGRPPGRGGAMPERPQKPASRAEEAEGVASAVATPASSAAAEESGDACPLDNEPIAFVQTNPKTKGKTSWDRYEKYKAARTPKEALSLGAAKGDLLHDFKKGFMKRR